MGITITATELERCPNCGKAINPDRSERVTYATTDSQPVHETCPE